MRLIDADELERTIDNTCNGGGIWEKPFRETMLAFIKLVGRQKTVNPYDQVLEIIDTFKDPLPEDAWLIGYDQAATDIYAAIEALKGGEVGG